MNAVLADLIAAIHLCIVIFMIAGQALILVGWPLGWQWIRAPLLRLPHLAIMAYIVINSLRGELCFLTTWEQHLRINAGQILPYRASPSELNTAREPISFVGRLLREALYLDLPQNTLDKVYLAFGALVILTLFGAPIRLCSREQAS